LTSISIGSGVTSIGSNAFFKCSGLTSITVDSNNTTYKSDENCLIVISTNTLFCGSNNSVIPNYVVTINNAAFYGCTGLTSITIPNSVTTIGVSAFTNCTGLTSITIPNTVTSLGNQVFYGCTGLTSVTIGSGITSLGVGEFVGCTGLTNIFIPSTVTTIEAPNYGSSLFYNCTSTMTITCGATEKPAGWGTYWNYYSSTGTLTVSWGQTAGENPTTITVNNTSGSALTDAYLCINKADTSLTTIKVNDTEVATSITSGDQQINITIPTGISTIKIINSGNWCGHTSCYPIIAYYYVDYDLGGDIYDSAYAKYITSISFDSYCTQIGGLQYATGLTWEDIAIPSSVTIIDNSAFFGCTGFTSVSIPNTITAIYNSSFRACTNLSSINIPNSVTHIDQCAFMGCTSLTSIFIPSSVTAIDSPSGGRIFTQCSSSLQIRCGASSQPAGWSSGWNNNGTVNLSVTWGQSS
jgi:hypothetical protein